MSLTSQEQNAEELPGFTTEKGHIPVRDKRNKNWHWKLNKLHDEFLHEDTVVTFAAAIGPSACTVYDYLCRRADEETQTCFPSVPTVAFMTGLTETTVTHMLSILGWMGMIRSIAREADEGDPTSNLYILLPVENWAIVGGKTELKDDLAKKQRERLTKLLKRKIPYALRKRYFASAQVSVEVVKNLTHPPKKEDPRVVKILNHPGLEFGPPLPENLGDGGSNSAPPLDQDSFVPDSGVVNTQPKQSPLAPVSADDENFSNSDLAPSAHTPEREQPQQSVRLKLLDFIELRKIKATSDEIDALLQEWPAARLRDDELVPALVSDYELYLLDKPADQDIARQAVKTDADRLRWFMCVWPGFEEAHDEYHERTKHRWTKAQIFFKRWKTAQPPANWLECELAQLRAAATHEIVAQETREAKTYWETLTGRQKAAVNKETLEILNQDGGGEQFAQSSEEFAPKRQELLLDAEIREWLAELEGGAEKAENAGESFDEDEFDDEPAPRPRQLSIETWVGPILSQIREKTLTLKELEAARPALLDDGEWRRVKDETVRRAYEEKLVA